MGDLGGLKLFKQALRLRTVNVTPSSYSTQGCSNRHIAETATFSEQLPLSQKGSQGEALQWVLYLNLWRG